MNRRHFLTLSALAAPAFVLDPERALWVPGQRKFFDLYRPVRVLTVGEHRVYVGDLVTVPGWHSDVEIVCPGTVSVSCDEWMSGLSSCGALTAGWRRHPFVIAGHRDTFGPIRGQGYMHTARRPPVRAEFG